MTQRLDLPTTTWHLTFGTYGTRLHGEDRPTVDSDLNERGQSFVERDRRRAVFERNRMRAGAVYLTAAQREVLESVVPDLCTRAGWTYRTCAVPADADHVHVLLDARPEIDVDAIMKWLQRWLGEELTKHWGKPTSRTWWARSGSKRAVKSDDYLNSVYDYIRRQRTVPPPE